MGAGGGGEEKALSFFRFHLSPFPQKRLILRLAPYSRSRVKIAQFRAIPTLFKDFCVSGTFNNGTSQCKFRIPCLALTGKVVKFSAPKGQRFPITEIIDPGSLGCSHKPMKSFKYFHLEI